MNTTTVAPPIDTQLNCHTCHFQLCAPVPRIWVFFVFYSLKEMETTGVGIPKSSLSHNLIF